MTTVQITLPDELAQKATSAGLLTAEAVEAMLREPEFDTYPQSLWLTSIQINHLDRVLLSFCSGTFY